MAQKFKVGNKVAVSNPWGFDYKGTIVAVVAPWQFPKVALSLKKVSYKSKSVRFREDARQPHESYIVREADTNYLRRPLISRIKLIAEVPQPAIKAKIGDPQPAIKDVKSPAPLVTENNDTLKRLMKEAIREVLGQSSLRLC